MSGAGLSGRVYLDTNILVFLLMREPNHAQAIHELVTQVKSSRIEAVSSELTLAELLVRPLRNADREGAQACRDLFDDGWLEVLPVSRTILERAAHIRSVRSIKLPDAIHAASALHAGCPALLTNDLRLRGVDGLRIVSLSSLGGAPPT